MEIGKRKIGLKHKPFIIGEISGNHKGSISRALKIIKNIKTAGGSACKLQTFDLDEMTLPLKNKIFTVNDKKSAWNNRSLYELYKEAHTPFSWHERIFKYSKKIKLLCFSSVFDFKSLDLLQRLNCPAYKIASFEINHFPLIEKVAKTKKPIILSTGMATLNEIEEAIKIIKFYKNKNFAVLKCTSSYPADPRSTNLKAINKLRKKFNCEVGLSDHTIGIGAAVASIPLGASIIEKHVTMTKKDKGIDSFFSSDFNEFSSLVRESYNAWQAIGKDYIGPSIDEKKSLLFRRSIFSSKTIEKGERLSSDNIKIVRPSIGMHPKFYYKLLNKKVVKKILKGTPLSKKLVQF